MLMCWIYQNFTSFDFFYISQGSVATYMCGRKEQNDFIANSLLNPKSKEFWESTNIW